MQDKINTFLDSYLKFSDKSFVSKLSYFINKFQPEKTTEKSLAVLCYCMCLPEESSLNLNKIRSSLDETSFSNFLEYLKTNSILSLFSSLRWSRSGLYPRHSNPPSKAVSYDAISFIVFNYFYN